jgi:hypothetical protein
VLDPGLPSSSKLTRLNRASELRTCASSWIGKHPPALGVDVGKCAVRQACAFARAQGWHRPIIVPSMGSGASTQVTLRSQPPPRMRRGACVSACCRSAGTTEILTPRRSSSVVVPGPLSAARDLSALRPGRYRSGRTRGRMSSRGRPSLQAAQPTRSGRSPNSTNALGTSWPGLEAAFRSKSAGGSWFEGCRWGDEAVASARANTTRFAPAVDIR